MFKKDNTKKKTKILNKTNSCLKCAMKEITAKTYKLCYKILIDDSKTPRLTFQRGLNCIL